MKINTKKSLRNKMFCVFMIFVLTVSYMPNFGWAVYAGESNNTGKSSNQNVGGALPTTPGSTISGEYDVTENTSLIATTAGQNGLVLGGDTVITIEEGVTLTVKGGDGSTASASSTSAGGGAGIYVPAGYKLTILGEGTLNAFGGKAGKSSIGVSGGTGSASYSWFTYSATTGGGGYGGNGAGGAGAAIGTSGGEGGQRGASGGSNNGGDNMSGNSGSKGSPGKNSAAAGIVLIGSKVTLNTTAGDSVENSSRASSGTNVRASGLAADISSAGGSAGGTGGAGGKGASAELSSLLGNTKLSIGSGGAGGGGAGGGASGTIRKADGIIYGPGGGGGAGGGYSTALGGAVPETSGYTSTAKQGGSTGSDGSAGAGGAGAGATDGSTYKGGTGGAGGSAGTAGSGGIIYTSWLKSSSETVGDKNGGNTAAVYQVFPENECEIILEEPDNPDGETYEWTSEGTKPNFTIKHIPTGTILESSAFSSQVVYDNPDTKAGKATLKITGATPNASGPALTDETMMNPGSMTKEFYIKYGGTVSGVSTSNKSYDGQPYVPTVNEPKVVLNDGSGTEISNPNLIYTYTKDTKNGKIKTNEAPKDVGNYTLVLTTDPSENYSVQSNEYKFSITPHTCDYVSSDAENRYFAPNDSSVEITSVEFANLIGEEELTPDVDYKITNAKMADPNVGTGKNVSFDLTLLNDNYAFEDSSQRQVKTITANTTVDIYQLELARPTPSGTEFIFDGTKQTYDVPGMEGLYSVTGNEETNAGEHTATYKLLSPGNACWEGGSTEDVSITWEISKAESPILETENLFYQTTDSGSKTYKLKLLNTPVGFKLGNTFATDGKDDPNDIIDDWSIDNSGNVTFTLASSKAEGNSADLYYTVNGTNYEESSGTLHIGLIDDKIGVTLEGVTITDKEYDGQPVEPTGTLVVKDNEGNVVEDITSSDIEYKYYDEDDSELPGAPSEMGNYYLIISTSELSKYSGTTGKIPFSITKKEISVVSATAVSRTYEKGNTSVDIDAVEFSGGVILQKGIDYTLTQGTMADDKAGVGKEATFTITLINDHYSFADGATETDATALATISPLKVEIPTVDPIQFDGNLHTPIVETEQYSISGQLSGFDVGEYATVLELKDKQDTVWENGTVDNQTVNWEIYKNTFTFDDESITHTSAETGEKTYSFGQSLPVGMDVGLKYSLYSYEAGNVLSGTPSVDETSGKVSYTLNESKEVGDSASITVGVESTNYEDTSITLEIDITSKKEAVISGGSVESKVHYDGTPVAPSIDDLTITSGEEDITSEIVDGGYLEYKYYKNVDGVMAPYEGGAPKDAGEYQLVLAISDENEIYVGSANPISFTIGKQPLTVTAGPDVKVSKVYDGTTNAEGHYQGDLIVEGIIPSETDFVTVNANILEFSEPNCHSTTKAVGLYIVGDGSASSNYELNNTTVNIPYEITQRTISIDGATADSRPFAEGDTNATISSVTFNNVVYGETIDYTIVSAAAQSEYAGVQSVDFRVKLNNGNYTFETGDTIDGVTNIVITKASSIDFGVQGVENYTYMETGERTHTIDTSEFPAGMQQGVTLAADSKVDEKNIIGDWDVEGNVITYALQGGEVGDVATLVVKVDSNNYESSYVSLKVILTEKDQATITGAAADNKEYDQQPVSVDTTNLMIKDSHGNDITEEIRTAGHIEISYYKAGQTDTPLSSAPKAAGHYGWKVSISDENVKFAGSQLGEFIIAPHEVSADASNFKYTKSYDTTNAINGVEGTITVNGVYSGDNVSVIVKNPGYENPNVQDGNLSKLIELSSRDADNYVLDSESIEIEHEIIPAKIKLSSAKAVDRGFISGDRTVAISDVVFDNLPGTEVPEYSAMGIMGDDAIGTGKAVTYAVMLNDSNYLFEDGQPYASGQTTVNIKAGESAQYDTEVEAYAYTKTGDFTHKLQFNNPPPGINVTSTELVTPTPIKGISNIDYNPSTSTISYSLTGTADKDTIQDITVNVISSNYETCTIMLKIYFTEKAKVTITDITASGKTYDGNQVASPDVSKAKAVDEEGQAVTIAPTDYQFAYYKNTVTEENELEAAPTDVGTYYVVPWVENNDYIGRCEPIKFEIAKADATVNAGTFQSTKVYDGTQAPNYAGDFEISGVVDADKSKVSATPEIVNFGPNVGKGSKDVFVSLGGERAFNYNLTTSTVSVPFEITPREISIKSANASNRTYEAGNIYVRMLSAVFDNVVSGESVAYSVSTGTMKDANAGVKKDVSYTVTLLGTSNYSFAGGVLSAEGNTTVDIAKLNGIDYGSAQEFLTYQTTGPQSNEFRLDHPTGMSVGIEYSISDITGDDIINDAKVSFDGKIGKLTYTAIGGNIGDKATITIKITSTNYTDSIYKYELALTDKREVSIDGVSFGEHIYDKNPAPLQGTLSIKYNGTDVTDQIDPTHVLIDYYKDGQLVKGAPTDAGDYQARIFISDKELVYKGQSTMIPLTITKAPLEVTKSTVKASKTYDGTTEARLTGGVTFSGVVPGDETKVIVAPVMTEYSTKDVQSVMKTLQLKLSGVEANNYSLNQSTLEVPYTITPKTVTVGNVVAQNRTYENGNLEVAINDVTFDGVVSGEKPGYTVENGVGYMEDDNAGINKVVRGSVTIESKNYVFNGSASADTSPFETKVNIAKTSGVSFNSETEQHVYTQIGPYEHEFSFVFPPGMNNLKYRIESEAYDPSNILKEYSIDENTGKITYTLNSGHDRGGYAKIPIIIESSNFENSGSSLEIYVAGITQVTISGMWVDNKVYDGGEAPIEGQFKANVDDVDVTALINPEDILYKYYKVEGEGRYALDNPPVDVGKYELDVVVNGEIFQGTKTYPYEITQKELTIEGQTINAKVGDKAPDLKTYDKDKLYKITGLVDGETLVKEPVATYAKTPDMSKAGEYAINFSNAVPTENYVITKVTDGKLVVTSGEGPEPGPTPTPVNPDNPGKNGKGGLATGDDTIAILFAGLGLCTGAIAVLLRRRVK